MTVNAISRVYRVSTDQNGRTRWLYAGPYRTAERAEISLDKSFADGDVSIGERPDVVKRGGSWWVEVDA